MSPLPAATSASSHPPIEAIKQANMSALATLKKRVAELAP